MDTQHANAPDAARQNLQFLTADMANGTPQKNSYISLNHEFIDSTVAPWTQQMIDLVKAKGYKFVTVGECRGERNSASWYRA